MTYRRALVQRYHAQMRTKEVQSDDLLIGAWFRKHLVWQATQKSNF